MFSSSIRVVSVGLAVAHAKRALLVIDMQDCFSNTNSTVGTLPVDDATDSYFQRTAAWIESHGQFYDKIIYSRDYHMKGHVSFLKTHFPDKTDDYARSILASSHSVELACAKHDNEGFCSPRLNKFDPLTGELELASCKPDPNLLTLCEDAAHPPLLAVKNGSRVNYAAEHCLVGPSGSTSCQSLVQSLWPEHCVDDNEMNPLVMKALQSVNKSGRVEVIFKGTDLFVDSYSAFNDNVNFTDSQMPRILRDNNIEQTHVIGLAYDFCVGQTALSSKARGHPTTVIAPFTAAVAPFLADLMSKQLAANNVEMVSEDGLDAWERKTFGAAGDGSKKKGHFLDGAFLEYQFSEELADEAVLGRHTVEEVLDNLERDVLFEKANKELKQVVVDMWSARIEKFKKLYEMTSARYDKKYSALEDKRQERTQMRGVLQDLKNTAQVQNAEQDIVRAERQVVKIQELQDVIDEAQTSFRVDRAERHSIKMNLKRCQLHMQDAVDAVSQHQQLIENMIKEYTQNNAPAKLAVLAAKDVERKAIQNAGRIRARLWRTWKAWRRADLKQKRDVQRTRKQTREAAQQDYKAAAADKKQAVNKAQSAKKQAKNKAQRKVKKARRIAKQQAKKAARND